jgi:hypothetical protein
VSTYEASLHVLEGVYRSTHLEHLVEFRLSAFADLLRLRFDHFRTVEDVAVLQKVRLVSEDLLGAQRPLLIPRTGQTESFVPGGELDRPRPRVLRLRNGEHLEKDPVDVVLGLGRGQAQ